MDNLPVEVIGSILSQLRAARDVVVASATCRKWQEAWRTHLHALSFDSNDWPAYHDILPSRLEIVITQTIFQTRGLESLSILMDDLDEFSAAPVIAWLLYTRDSLRELCYNVRTTPNVNILENCGRHKLEDLSLVHNSIISVEPSYQKFPRLRSLSLTSVSISALDLSLLLNVCPKLEVLKLIYPDIEDIAISDAGQTTLELSSTSLRDFYIEGFGVDKVILEGDHIEKLNLKDCTYDVFLFVGKGGLRVLKIDDVSVLRLEIGENTENLEVIDVSNFTIMWLSFYEMISRSQKLRKLRLWGVVFEYDDEFVDFETLAVSFPQLSHLSLSYDLREYNLHYAFRGASCLENVVVLELGWTTISDLFSEWLSGLLKRCHNLKKLVIYGAVSGSKTHIECNGLACFTSSIVRLMRIYAHVEVSFEFE